MSALDFSSPRRAPTNRSPEPSSLLYMGYTNCRTIKPTEFSWAGTWSIHAVPHADSHAYSVLGRNSRFTHAHRLRAFLLNWSWKPGPQSDPAPWRRCSIVTTSPATDTQSLDSQWLSGFESRASTTRRNYRHLGRYTFSRFQSHTLLACVYSIYNYLHMYVFLMYVYVCTYVCTYVLMYA